MRVTNKFSLICGTLKKTDLHQHLNSMLCYNDEREAAVS
jgi:hypothetical protein